MVQVFSIGLLCGRPFKEKKKNKLASGFSGRWRKKKNEISSEGIAQLIRSLIRRCQMPAHNTIPHTARRCIATWSHHIGREIHWWEEGGKKRHSQGTQEEKWITVRGRVGREGRGGGRRTGLWAGLFSFSPQSFEGLNAAQPFFQERSDGDSSHLIPRKEEILDVSVTTLRADANRRSNELRRVAPVKKRSSCTRGAGRSLQAAIYRGWKRSAFAMQKQRSADWSSHLRWLSDRLLRECWLTDSEFNFPSLSLVLCLKTFRRDIKMRAHLTDSPVRTWRLAAARRSDLFCGLPVKADY